MPDSNQPETLDQATSDEIRSLLQKRRLTVRSLQQILALVRESLPAEELGRLYALTGRISTEERYEAVNDIVGPRLAPEVGREREAALFDWVMGDREGEPPD